MTSEEKWPELAKVALGSDKGVNLRFKMHLPQSSQRKYTCLREALRQADTEGLCSVNSVLHSSLLSVVNEIAIHKYS